GNRATKDTILLDVQCNPLGCSRIYYGSTYERQQRFYVQYACKHPARFTNGSLIIRAGSIHIAIKKATGGIPRDWREDCHDSHRCHDQCDFRPVEMHEEAWPKCHDKQIRGKL